ncbi:agmatine deiminase family protein [Tepidibacter hydrothermalis]|uniref:Agmatine deiminase family protein n=1 Tax=Tepidibacter hydrothermalis TaxID=3036126 RepID=A0ABY8EFR8_9FIRM|nr:agmatine deiminase family protein [Tepidibacter hydrothermalis]WFD11796.1 agmatine deiminase family protein [Tepidibacter hydrothermalis]
MYRKKILSRYSIIVSMICMLCVGCTSPTGNIAEKEEKSLTKADNTHNTKYVFPFEDEKHEGTWLQWPHDYTYGKGFKDKLDPIWVEMTRGLTLGENVHIIVYNEKEKNRIENLLIQENIDIDKVDFYVYPTDDVWVRDNGPIFVYDKEDNLLMADWGFNGWGKKASYKKCSKIPESLSKALSIPLIDIHEVILEGGAVEFDGNGTCLSTRSAVVNKNRNPNLTEKEIEQYIETYYGVSNVIWLDGVAGQDITDFHIDGFAKFYDKSTILTMNEQDLIEWGVSEKDINTLLEAKDVNGNPYEYIYLPLSKHNVVLENGKDLGYKGSYANFYIGNKVVLVPNYNDENDENANAILQELYPNKEVIGIDVRDLYQYGGMIHCVTQQQPINKN